MTASAFGEGLSSKAANFEGKHPYNSAPKGPTLSRTTTVGSYLSNAWGLHDMHGNVWEWCSDWYVESLQGGRDPEVIEKPSAKSPARVSRGGSWNSDGQHCLSSHRNAESIFTRNFKLGFRVAIVRVRQ